MSTSPPLEPTPETDLVSVEDIVPDRSLVTELRRRRAITPITRALLAVVVAGGAFLGGVLVEKSQAKSSSSSALPSGVPANIAALFGGRTSTTVAGAGSGTTSTATQTFGTIKLVDGKNVYVTDTSGNVVKVATSASSQLTKTDPATTSDVAPGDVVIVRGTQNSDGSYTAQSLVISTAGALGGTGAASAG